MNKFDKLIVMLLLIVCTGCLISLTMTSAGRYQVFEVQPSTAYMIDTNTGELYKSVGDDYAWGWKKSNGQKDYFGVNSQYNFNNYQID